MKNRGFVKQLILIWIFLLCLLFTACGNDYAKKEYNADEKIVQPEDRYAKDSSVFNPIDGGYSLTAAKFDGRQTLWTKECKEEQEIRIDFSLQLSKGTAKIVHIDNDGNVTTVIECSSDTQPVNETKSIVCKAGKNRLKIVGYNCRDIDFTMLLDEEMLFEKSTFSNSHTKTFN